MYIFVCENLSINMYDIGMYYEGYMIYVICVLVIYCIAVRFTLLHLL
jgi:hypothetical protein